LIKFKIIGVFSLLFFLFFSIGAAAQDKSDCLMCHGDKTQYGERNGKKFSIFVDEKKLNSSVHGKIDCIGCHIDLKGSDFPHTDKVQKASCGGCHADIQKLYDESLHGQAIKKGDKLAPYCKDCHGNHEILSVKDPKSTVYPMKIPMLCGRCHREGSPVQIQRHIPQDSILENYSESIHGEGLLKKGLLVAASCVSCHSSHHILPHTDSRSTIARNNIAHTCAACHVGIEQVHRRIIKGQLWEKEANILPACVDCHQPHKIRKVFYDQGFADKECMSCHERKNIKSSVDGRSLFVDYDKMKLSMHAKIACSQCHTGVNPSKMRPCENLNNKKVDCASCHSQVGLDYQKSIHGKLFAKNDPNAPVCTECHGTHEILGKKNPDSPIFATNIPVLCGSCHREGEKAAVRKHSSEKNIITNYSESIHGRGLLKSGLTVTATCTNCHTAHRELPHTDSESSVNPKNVASTCGACHHGIQEQFEKSVHSVFVTKTDKKLPSCNDCHTAHGINRTDSEGFRLKIMDQCGKCHEEIAKTYFDTYHGKVSQLGYAKTAKCYDCHGSHDILPVSNPSSHLNRKNVVKTCQKCHANANKQFAGYFTHATHHDPAKYPLLFWTFYGMMGLLVCTFVIAGIHTLLWLPRSLQWRRKLKKMQSSKDEEENSKE
jgi:hypothetical protein